MRRRLVSHRFVLGLILDTDGGIAAGIVGKGPGSNAAGARVSGSHATTVSHNLTRVLVSCDRRRWSYLDEAANVINMVSCPARRLHIWASCTHMPALLHHCIRLCIVLTCFEAGAVGHRYWISYPHWVGQH
jgi:hypothetical protein